MRLPADLAPDRLDGLAERHGTPLYVTAAATVRRRYAELDEAFPDATVQFAAKANGNPHLLALLRREGAHLDCVSRGEIAAGERAGFDADEMMYTGVNPPLGELATAVDRGVTVNADSVSGIRRIASAARDADGAADADDPATATDADADADAASAAGDVPMGIRVNPGVGAGHHDKVATGGAHTKFGVPRDRLPAAVAEARDLGLEPRGLHMHVGSGVMEPDPLVEAAEALADVAEELVEDHDVALDYVDVGGGLGVPYRPGEDRLDLDALASGVRGALGDVLDATDARLVVEPGRYLVAESTVLLARVNTRKDRFVGVDAGMHTLARPAVYDSYHHVTNCSRDASDGGEETVDVVGPICETGDALARDRALASPEEGDLLAVHTAGAYGYSMASRYNGRPLPAEVLVDGGEERVIRERETVDDLFERVPEP